MPTKKEIGQKLEEYVLSKVKEIDPQARIYSNCKQKDIMCNFAYGECKKRNTKDFTIKESVWLHLNNNLPINTKKFCFLVNENKNSRRLIMLDVEDFFRILNEGLGAIKPKEGQKFYYSSEYLGDHKEKNEN